MKKPSKELRTRFSTDYNDRSIFAANARLLQSVWREAQAMELNRNYGNFLDYHQAYKLELNFLTPTIKNVVKNELEANEKRVGSAHKVIRKDRLYENLLASQPLAFNLFGELITSDFSLATKVFQRFYGDKIEKVTGIEFEISPGRGSSKYTGDRSAFDVFVTYTGKNGKGFIGFEIKYAETLLDAPASFKERYREVAIESGKFSEEGLKTLVTMPESLEQVWRDHLLSLSMIPPVNSDYDEGFFVYLFPKLNDNCVTALDRYDELLKSDVPEKSGIYRLFMEDLIDTIKQETNANWVRDFEDRYLDFEKLNHLV